MLGLTVFSWLRTDLLNHLIKMNVSIFRLVFNQPNKMA